MLNGRNLQAPTIERSMTGGPVSGAHALLEHLYNDLLVLVAEGGQTPGFEQQLVMLTADVADRALRQGVKRITMKSGSDI